MADSNMSRYRAKRRERGDVELRDYWLTRDQRRALVAMRLVNKEDIDNPDACMDAIDFIMAGVAKKFRKEV